MIEAKPVQDIKDIISPILSDGGGVEVILSSAGSGKTFVLTSIYIALLLQGIPAGQVLAITFTNEAAKEMRQRIISRLFAIADGSAQEEAGRFAEALSLAPFEVVRRAQSRIFNLFFREYQHLAVQTIDSLINSFRMTFLRDMGFAGNVAVEKNVGPHIPVVLRELIEGYSDKDKIKPVLDDFINLFTENLSLYNSWDPIEGMREVIKSFMDEESSRKRQITGDNNPPKDIWQLLAKISAKRERLLSAEGLKKNAKDAISLLSPDNIKRNYKDILAKALWKNIQENPCNLFKKSAQHEAKRYIPALEDILALMKEFAEETSRRYYAPYVDLYKAFVSAFEDYQRREGRLFVDLIQRDFARLNAVEVLERMYEKGSQYRYIMVDEFQDTNIAQWENLLPVIKEAVSNGGSLIVVGDPKQTIYRWRGSRHNIFEAVFKDIPANYHYFVLPSNWRSAREIVEFNNKRFALTEDRSLPLSGAEGMADPILNALRRTYNEELVAQSPARSGVNAGVVEFIEVQTGEEGEDSGADRRLETITSLIERLRQEGWNYNDIAVLVRTNTQASEVFSGLLASGIPAFTRSSSSIFSYRIVQDLLVLCRYIVRPHEDEFFKTAVMTDLFACLAGAPREVWHKWLAGHSGQAGKDFKAEYPDLYQKIFQWPIENVAKELLYDGLLLLFRHYGLYQKFAEYSDLFDFLFDITIELNMPFTAVEELMQGIYGGDGPNDYAIPSAMAEADGIRILTIHSAKGLEFPVVILACGETEFVSRKGKEAAKNILYKETNDGSLVPYYVIKAMRISEDIARLYDAETALMLWDSMNLLYVAATRPIERLYIITSQKGGSNDQTWAGWLSV